MGVLTNLAGPQRPPGARPLLPLVARLALVDGHMSDPVIAAHAALAQSVRAILAKGGGALSEVMEALRRWASGARPAGGGARPDLFRMEVRMPGVDGASNWRVE
jgi:CheY-like chemotaxis protein